MNTSESNMWKNNLSYGVAWLLFLVGLGSCNRPWYTDSKVPLVQEASK